MGSGSHEKDRPFTVVAVKKEEQTGLMHDHRLGKGERHADKTSQTLAQRIIPALHMGCFSGFFANSSMLLVRDDRRVCHPKVSKAVPLQIPLRNRLPQTLARLCTPITQRISDDLARLATQSNPHPDLVDFFEHKRPQFIQFQCAGSSVFWVRSQYSRAERRKLSYFFLIQRDTVVRETPNVRVRPRKRLRS